jgi:hypothetical protein
MKFVLANDRTPYPQSFCALCCEPIAETYLREIATRLSYYDHRANFGHRKLEGSKRSKSSKAVVLTSSIATPLGL